MIRIPLLLTCLLFGLTVLPAQSTFWLDQDENSWTDIRSAQRQIVPEQYRTIHIDASKQATGFLRWQGKQTLTFPTPDGKTKTFEVKKQSNFHPRLARKYPSIQSFTGVDPDQPHHRLAFSVGPAGVHAVFDTEAGTVYIDPYQKNNRERHIAYFTHDHKLPTSLKGQMSCGDDAHQWDVETGGALNFMAGSLRSNETVNLFEYDIAIATTGEYTQANGGTVEDALNSINVALTRVNFIFVRDMAVRFRLVADNDQVIFLDPDTDPYDDDNISSLLNDNRTTLASILGPDSYDLGHVFAGPCGGGTVGQAALGGTCNTQRKARAASCQTGANDRFYIDIVCHEIGHQFNATHTFNNCPPNEGQTSPGSAFEPGGGSTIMSYANACGTQSFQNRADQNFHVHSLRQMYDYSRRSGGLACASQLPTDNTLPSVDIPLDDPVYIPINTPFKLTATGRDDTPETLTYSWEQYDLDPVTSSIGNPQGNDPSFRSFEPRIEPYRYFPDLFNVIVGIDSQEEVLPTYSRDLTFRCTVRDNDVEAGGVDWEEVRLRATEQAGPFRVIAPNRNLEYIAGREYEVRWDVANTDQPPVNCQFVNILLSLDRGNTIFDTLARNTRNDGLAYVVFPDTTTIRGRVFVEAADNVFFDVSDEDLMLKRAEDTTFSLKPNPAGIPLNCQPEMIRIDLASTRFNAFEQPIALSLLDPPAEINYNLQPSVINPGDSAVLRILAEAAGRNTFDLMLQAVAGADTVLREITVVSQSNAFTDFQPLFPVNGTSDILLSTDLTWSDASDADYYELQLATNPSFELNSIVEQQFNYPDTTYAIQSILNDSELYYWRVQAFNSCGPGPYSEVQTFHTANTLCDGSEATDVPINISGIGLPTIESTIEITQEGTISDINIPFLKANYQPVNSLRLTLISPSGTEVILFDENCGNTVNLSIGFDDDAPRGIQCPPDDGIVFRPDDSLVTFIGEPTAGTWTLRVAVVDLGFGASGGLEEWRLEFCTNQTPQPPSLATNDTLFVPPGLTNTLTPDVLRATDPDNSSSELIYTLLEAPRHGNLSALGQPLSVGDQFTQRDIDVFHLAYTHDSSLTVLDSARFILEDGTGGFLNTIRLPIKIDEDAVVSTDDVPATTGLKLYPVPARNQLRLELRKSPESDLSVRIFDAQGRPLLHQKLMRGRQTLDINTSSLPAGMYFLRLTGKNQQMSRAFSIMR